MNSPSPLWTSILVGFAAAVTMWLVWFVVHHPAVGLSASASGPILIGVQLTALTVFTTRWLHARARIIPATVAGFSCGLINLASMGSMLVPQTDPSQGMAASTAATPSLVVTIGGYLALSAALGLVAGFLASFLTKTNCEPDARTMVRRMGQIALAATLPLLLLGGLVTSSRAGLAVPDWPGTYGGNMFLYPISLMASEKHVYLEHSHRLFGTLVGMASISLLVFALRFEARAWMKVWAGAILALVVVQGLLGGFRVTESSTGLALAHGVLGQVVFLLMAMFAAYTTDAYVAGPSNPDPLDRKRRAFATALLHSLLLQLALGAAYRHTGHAHVLYTHIAFAFLVTVMGMLAGMSASGRTSSGGPYTRLLRPVGSTVVAVVALQFILGWGAWAANPPGEFRAAPNAEELATATPVAAWKVAIRTAHQANGAVLLASAGVLFVLARRVRRGETGSPVGSPVGVPSPVLSSSAER
jgi:cytochrome c oxidase assembly protein subunit 15